MNDDIYNIIDSFLNHLLNHNGKEVINFEDDNENGILAISKIEEYRLAKFPIGNKKTTYSLIEPNGRKAINAGGSKIYITSIENVENEKGSLEFKKLSGDVEKLKYDIKNAKNLPWQFWATFALSLCAIAISIFAYCKKQ
jgi:hypothetical protein